MSVSDILDRAAERLSKPGAWTQGEFARDANGQAVNDNEDDAVCWCVAGALRCEGGDLFWEARRQLDEAISGRLLTLWNDDPSRTQAEVVATLREAAAKAREQGK